MLERERLADADVAFAGVAGQLELLRRGERSSRDLVELALRRSEDLGRRLNAFGAVYRDAALAAADEADRRRADGDTGPLLGIPVAVKDEMDVRGEVTSRGMGT